VKSTAEVLDLLRQVGVDTGAEGFGVMSKIDDDTIAKLHAQRNGVEVKTEKPKTRLRAADQPLEVDLKQKSTRRRPAKDFFGAKPSTIEIKPKPDFPEPATEQKPPAKRKTPVARAKASTTTAPKPKSKAGGTQKLDLSTGPRIISMPDPAETRRLKQQREAPDTPAAPASAPRKKRRKGAKEAEKREQVGAGRRRIKEIGGKVDEEQRVRSRKRVFKVAGQRSLDQPVIVPHIKITGPLSLREVAKKTGIKVLPIVRFLMNDLEIMAGINYTASVEEVQLIAENFEIKHTVALEQEPEHELSHFEVVDDKHLDSRPPVVTVMGHVDHGKTKLLDAIRATNVVADEAGGITQHIGAYQVEKKGKRITFIDTPGHEAFTAMRARGSLVTDIVILVVAADDGVMPQTIEAINHSKAADVPIIVAVNKIDKADAQPDRVRNQLNEYGLVPEEWGGDTVFINISALKQEGIDDLLEMILLTAELVDPKADPTAPPCGVVIESQVDIGIGVVATVLVQQGEMANGQFLLSGTAVGRIKRMESDTGDEVLNAGPAMPVRIIGFNEPPENGDRVYSFKNKKQAQAIADQRVASVRAKATAGASGRMTLEAFFKKAEEGEIKDLNLVVKADVCGSAEALVDALGRIEVAGAKCHVISSGVGQINDTDVNLAAASDAVIIGFNVNVSGTAKQLTEREHVDVRLYDIIYEITENVEMAMKGLLAPKFEERPLGRVEIRAIFKQDRSATVCGCYVLDGLARRGAKYRLLRGKDVVLREMTLHSLKRFKDDVREVASGFECGLLVENNNVEEGDILELFEIVEVARD
jgi:translation initiation factor IF-2